jgi:antitoxin ParD1/3/4
MNVSLTPELERLISRKVKTGRYTSASEVVREALRLLDERDRVRQTQLAAIEQKIDRGLRQLERGEGTPGDQARAQLRRTRSK